MRPDDGHEHEKRFRVLPPATTMRTSDGGGSRPGDRGRAMGVAAGFRHPRTRAVLGASAIAVVTIIIPSAGSPTVTAEPGPLTTPFDSNGFDNSFLIAQSRQEGPVFKGSEARTTAAVPALGDPVKGTFGA